MGIRVTVTRISATLGLTRNGGGWPCLVPLGTEIGLSDLVTESCPLGALGGDPKSAWPLSIHAALAANHLLETSP